jgi:hypothetical protein
MVVMDWLRFLAISSTRSTIVLSVWVSVLRIRLLVAVSRGSGKRGQGIGTVGQTS